MKSLFCLPLVTTEDAPALKGGDLLFKPRGKEVTNLEPWLTNRQKRLQPKRGLFWCGRCDGNHVSGWRKCSVCGARNGIRRNKK